MDKPSVATYADHEVISPPHKLRRTLSTVAVSPVDDPVARAEQALAQLSGEFSTWMEEEGRTAGLGAQHRQGRRIHLGNA